MSSLPANNIKIDENDPDFYDKCSKDLGKDLLVMQANIQGLKQCRMAAAELLLQTAALHHAKLMKTIISVKEKVGMLKTPPGQDQVDASKQ